MDVYLGNIMCFAFNFAPLYWLECNGQTLNISTNQTLYSLIGTTFGGNGSTTFCVPNLNGTINANNASTAVTFQYGLTTDYGTNVTASQSPLTGTSDTPVSYAISGLTANTLLINTIIEK